MGKLNQLLVFALDGERYGLVLSAVDSVVRAVNITPLPQAPDIVLGVVNVRGRVIPVINMRRRFRLPERKIVLTDQLVIARTTRRPVALVADAVSDILQYPEGDIVETQSILADAEYIEGVVKLNGGLILIHNLDTFLSLEEETSLDQAIESG
ncbi:MAG: chemotaxis protein CheW [Betaproteobacteria bacterium HGW-Betaproteobacteria-11]|nr:MAG: chemotaxis protein CheW [Betaproteobacteria bacterium HGW-Betaproteobacteria-11]